VTLSYLPDREFRGRVTYVYPTWTKKRARRGCGWSFTIPATFSSPACSRRCNWWRNWPSALLVPDSAVLRSGEKNTVFVALPGGKFEARTVALGLEGGERHGPGAQRFERRRARRHVRPVHARFGKPVARGDPENVESERSGGAEPMPGKQTKPATRAGRDQCGRNVVWVCPMPEHVSITYDHPGKCPICGMTLVPVTKSTARKTSARRQGALLHLPDAGAQRRARGQARQMPQVRHDADSRDAGGDEP
jgi:hypothetical protein